VNLSLSWLLAAEELPLSAFDRLEAAADRHVCIPRRGVGFEVLERNKSLQVVITGKPSLRLGLRVGGEVGGCCVVVEDQGRVGTSASWSI